VELAAGHAAHVTAPQQLIDVLVELTQPASPREPGQDEYY
jgi:hypothetical protein